MFNLKNLYNRYIPKEARHNFTVELIAYILLGVSNGFVVPFFYLIAKQEFDASPFWLGLMTAAGGIGYIVAFLTTGFIKPGKELFAYVWTLFLGRLFNVGIVLSLNAPIFSLFIFFSTCVQVIPMPQYGIIIQNIYPKYCRGALISYTRIVLTVVTLITTVLGGYLIEIWGWRPVFLISGIFAILATLILLKIKLPEIDYPKPLPIKDYLVYTFEILKEDALNRNIVIWVFVFVLGVQLTTIIMPITQVDILNVTTKELGILNGICTIAWIIAYWYYGIYIDKKGALRAFLLSFVLYTISVVFYIFAKDWKGLILSFIILGLYKGANDLASFNLWITLSPKGKENLYQGMNSLWVGVRAAVDVVIATWIINAVLSNSAFTSLRDKHIFLYIISIGIMVVSIIFQYLTYRKSFDLKRN